MEKDAGFSMTATPLIKVCNSPAGESPDAPRKVESEMDLKPPIEAGLFLTTEKEGYNRSPN